MILSPVSVKRRLHTEGKMCILLTSSKMQSSIYRPFKYTYTIASIWRENMLGYLSADIICFEQGTLCFGEQIKTKDKYPSIFSRQMAAILFIQYSSNPSRNTRSFENWGTYNNYSIRPCWI